MDKITTALIPNEFFAKINEVIDNLNIYEIKVNELDSKVLSLDDRVTELDNLVQSFDGRINALEIVVPPEATETNLLVDRDYLHATLQSTTGYFCGSWATFAAIPNRESGFIAAGQKPPVMNCYLIIESDAEHANARCRYKYNDTVSEEHPYDKNKWVFEYPISESPFTEAEKAALASGINATKVGNYDSHVNNSSIHVDNTKTTKWDSHVANDDIHVTKAEKNIWTAKQDKMTAGTNISITNDGVVNCTYTLPIASSSVLGGIKIGANITLDTDGTLNINNASQVNYGIVKVGSGIAVNNGIISAPGTNPTGTIIAFAGPVSKIPSGYLLCNGDAKSRTEYLTLFNVIGTLYGAGNGSTTFNLPKLTDNRFLEGSNESSGTYVSAGLPNVKATGLWAEHSGYYRSQDTPTGAAYLYGSSSYIGSSDTDYDNQRIDFDASRCSSIYGNSTTVQPKSLRILYLIKY